MSSHWRTVRLFLSSTFRDMHAERDFLIKKVFPGLRERLRPHRVELLDIDLRWGITEEESRNEQVVALCLDQVRECQPFFLGFLGQRYGWIPGQLPAATRQRFPEVDSMAGQGVTEMEIRFGALLDPTGKRALFCLRDDATLAGIPETTRQRDYLEPDSFGVTRLDALKEELRQSPFPCQDYKATWQPGLWDRINRTRGKLDIDPALGPVVEDWLWKAIVAEFNLPEEPTPISPLEAERDLHERFAESRLRIYVGRDDVYQRLLDFALTDSTTPALVTGESGLGKSAALARFVRDFRREHPEVLVLCHYVGASPYTTSLPTMLRRLCEEMKAAFDFALPIPDSADEILRTFNAFLTSIPEDRRVVFVFDALNQLDADTRAESLVWLPKKLPSHVKVIASCVTGPERPPRVLTTFGDRPYVDVPMPPLTDAERREIIRAVPRVVAKTLDARQVNALLSNPATRNPLYLMVALEELRGYGSYENLSRRIAEFPQGTNALRELFEKVFTRLETEFGKPLVERVLPLLACARRGLTGPELEALTADLAEKADDLHPLLHQIRPYLHSRDGRYDFFHTSIRRAAETRYLDWEREENQHDPFTRWAEITSDGLKESTASDPTEPELETRQRLIGLFSVNRLSDRAIEELSWQLAQLRDWQGLCDVLTDLPFLEVAYPRCQVEVLEYWSLLQGIGRIILVEAYRSSLDAPGYQSGMWQLAHLLQTSGHPQEAGKLWLPLARHFWGVGDQHRESSCLGNHAVFLWSVGNRQEAMRFLQEEEEICRRLNLRVGTQRNLVHQALILHDGGDLDGARRLLKEAEEICRQLNHPAGLQHCLGNKAVILRETGDLDGAMQLLEKQESICRRINDPIVLQASLGNRAMILRASGDLEGAMRLLKEAESICRRFNYPAGLQRNLGGQGLILQATGDLDEAMKVHKAEEEISKSLNDPSGLATSLGNQAVIHQRRGDLQAAMQLLKQQESICRDQNLPDGLQVSLGNQAVILRETGDLEGAMRLHGEEEEICKSLNNIADLHVCLVNQARILHQTGQLDLAMSLYKQVEDICNQLKDPNGLANSLINQASILALKFKRPAEGLPLAEQAYRLATQHGLVALAQQIQPILDRIRRAAEG